MQKRNSRARIIQAALGFVALLGVSAANAGVLDKVKAHGALRCGVAGDQVGFSLIDDKGHWTGMDVDLCRAVAAAVLGDADKVEYVATTAKNRFTALASGEIDVLSRATTWTADRVANLGVDFTTVWFYDAQGFLVHTQDGIGKIAELDGATICLSPGTTSEQNLEDYFSRHGLTYKSVIIEKGSELFKAFQTGRCNAVSDDQSRLSARRTALANADSYGLLDEVISKEPLGPYVAQGDVIWRNVVTWTAYALMAAEDLGVTQANVDAQRGNSDAPAEVARLLGSQGAIGKGFGLDADWAYRAIKQVGNYAEIFERNLGEQSGLKFPRGLNASWRNGGLLSAPPIR